MTDAEVIARAEEAKKNRVSRFYLTQIFGIISALILGAVWHSFIYGKHFSAETAGVISWLSLGVSIIGATNLFYSLCRLNKGRYARRLIYAAIIYLVIIALRHHDGNIWLAAGRTLLFLEGLLGIGKSLAFLCAMKYMNGLYPITPPVNANAEQGILFRKTSKF